MQNKTWFAVASIILLQLTAGDMQSLSDAVNCFTDQSQSVRNQFVWFLVRFAHSCTLIFRTNHAKLVYNAKDNINAATIGRIDKDYLHTRTRASSRRCYWQPLQQLARVFVVAKFLPDVVVDDFVVWRHVLDELEELLPQLIRLHLHGHTEYKPKPEFLSHIGAGWTAVTPAATATTTKQDHQALLKAKYCPRVAAASCTQKNSKKNMWPWPLTYALEIP